MLRNWGSPRGSALFLASVCDALGKGRVFTIDVLDQPDRPLHARIEYVHGSSADPELAARLLARISPSDRVMVVLDSDHSKEHVLAELALYAPRVSVGCYLVVEDTNLNGNPVRMDFGPGPREAVEEFLAQDRRFQVDRACERFLLTFNPGGYLRRVRAGSDELLAQPAEQRPRLVRGPDRKEGDAAGGVAAAARQLSARPSCARRPSWTG